MEKVPLTGKADVTCPSITTVAFESRSFCAIVRFELGIPLSSAVHSVHSDDQNSATPCVLYALSRDHWGIDSISDFPDDTADAAESTWPARTDPSYLSCNIDAVNVLEQPPSRSMSLEISKCAAER